MSEEITPEEADYLRVRTAIYGALSGDLAEVDAGIVLGALLDVSLELVMGGDNVTEKEAIESVIATLHELLEDVDED